MKATGAGRDGKIEILPDTLEEYYKGAAKRFAHIKKLRLLYDEPSFNFNGGIIEGDFALLRAFLSDHEGSLSVEIVEGSDSEDGLKWKMFFPAYLYGFVEDTFARAIHHKIEGPGFACRECVGKRQLRLREYDGFLRLVSEDDIPSGVRMALHRLMYPICLADEKKTAYEDFLRKEDREAIHQALADKDDGINALFYLTKAGLLSEDAVEEVLPELSDSSDARAAAILIGYKKKRKRLVL